MAESPILESNDPPLYPFPDEPTADIVVEPPSAFAFQPRPATEIRDELLDLVVKDLHGPASGAEEEIDEDRVTERYYVGTLAPSNAEMEPERLDELAEGGADSQDDGKSEPTAAVGNAFMPSSFGMSFSVDGDEKEIVIKTGWGRYLRQPSDKLIDEKTGKPRLIWKRKQVSNDATILTLRDGIIAPLSVDDEQPGIVVRGRIRKTRDNCWIVTLFLVNGQLEPKQRKDEAWLFQTMLAVEGTKGRAVFCKKLSMKRNPERMDPVTRAEYETMDMLYRDKVEFATGHSVAVNATVSPDDVERATRIGTCAIPVYESPMQTPPDEKDNPNLSAVVLDMKTYAESKATEIAVMLKPLADAYEQWIGRERLKLGNPQDRLGDHQSAATKVVENCERALGRIRAGIQLLDRNPQANAAFRFSNRAMWQQRVRSTFVRKVRKGELKSSDALDSVDIYENRRWYPFQLAFILLNLPSTTELNHPDRSAPTDAVADLLWFPTGGGKTEAYLGLAAYAMALRRLQGAIGGRANGEFGVAVLMRYTLRLLTLQQFQRAAALICACELIRQSDPGTWRKEPFRLGLWVGMRATPNTTEQAQEALTNVNNVGYSAVSGTPAQLTYCPWCGTPVDPRKHIKAYPGTSRIRRTLIHCGDAYGNCPFSERNAPLGLPVLVVDDEIYRNPPSLLIATVDKFAQMPWNGSIQMLFGQVNGYCPRHGFRSPEIDDVDRHPKSGGLPPVVTQPTLALRPPDLIIQDELHLICGPLGSLMGLYETAVDALCTWEVEGKPVRPKLIASTATIKRATDQVYKLFVRKTAVFPPSGTSASDNFFSIRREPSVRYPGRTYVGICAIGRRYPATLIRVYVAYLAAARKLYEQFGNRVDPWMTLVGYFNSIREMGGTRRLVEDDVASRLRDADKRGLAKRNRPILEELTSRKSGTDIPETLDKLERTFRVEDDRLRAQQRANKMPITVPYPLDVVLATNMISVGVDVPRLGLMVVAGQPKTTAEYIQATSRVGRSAPGIVCTVYNWGRPRDLSHYETFENYHATFYKHVEALSVTPFSSRARDRGLSAVMVSLIRLANESMNGNRKAGSLDRNSAVLAQAVKTILERALAASSLQTVADQVRQEIDKRRDEWLRLITARAPAQLGYRKENDGRTVPLLNPAGEEIWSLFTCLNSMRDVEPMADLILGDGYGVTPTPAGGPTV